MNPTSPDLIRLFVYFFMIVLAVGFFSACQTRNELNREFETSSEDQRNLKEPETNIEKAESLLKEGKVWEARQSFTAILVKQPQFNRAKIGLCEALRLSGDSLRALEIAITIFDDPIYGTEAKTVSALIEISRNNMNRAKELLEASLGQRQDQWRGWNALGIIHDKEGRWNEADESYEKALNFAPTPSVVFNNYGMSMLNRGNYEGGRKLFERGLEHDPTNDHLQNNWRVSLALLGRYREAAVGLDNKNSAHALNNIGYIAMVRGDYIQAESYLLQAIEASPTYFSAANKNLRILNTLKMINNK